MTKDRRNICNKEDSEFKQINLRGRKREREINRKSENKRREVTNSSGKGDIDREEWKGDVRRK